MIFKILIAPVRLPILNLKTNHEYYKKKKIVFEIRDFQILTQKNRPSKKLNVTHENVEKFDLVEEFERVNYFGIRIDFGRVIT